MALELAQNPRTQAEEGPVAWMCPVTAGRAGQGTAIGVRLPLYCPVIWEGTEMTVINFTSVLSRGERTFAPLPFPLYPASLMAQRTLPRLRHGRGRALD